MLINDKLASGVCKACILMMSVYPVSARSQSAAEPEKVALPSAPETLAPNPITQDAGEIVVTAQRRAQSLINIPISVTALSAETIRNAGITDVARIAQFAPNIRINTGADVGGTEITIRGLGAGTFTGAVEPSVGVFIDGVAAGSQTAISTELVDIERIEVLRGPQGTLYGRNTSSGALNIYTRAPNLSSFEGTALMRYSSFDDGLIQASLSGPIAQNLGLRVTGSWRTYDGKVKNLTYPGDRGRKSEDLALRGKLRWEPDAETRVELRGSYERGRRRVNYFDIVAADESALSGFQELAALDGGTAVFDVPDGIGSDTVRNDFRGRASSDVYVTSLQVDRSIGSNLGLTSITAYQDVRSVAEADVDNSELRDLASTIGKKYRQFSQELRLASKGDNDLDFVVGAFLFTQDFDTTNRAVATGPIREALINAFLPPEEQITLPPGTLVQKQGLKTRLLNLATFGQATYRIAKNLDIVAGLRLNYERKKGDRDPTGPSEGFLLDADIPRLQRTLSFTTLSGTLNAQYYWSDDIMSYLGYSRGTKSGGFNTDTLNNIEAFTFGSETSDSFEAGIKFRARQLRSTLNIAVFNTIFKGLQVVAADPRLQDSQLVRSVPRTTARGVEVELTTRPVPQLSISAGIGYTDAFYNRFPDVLRLPAAGGGLQDLSGAPVFNAPKWNVNLSTQYERQLGNLPLNGSLRLDYSYASSSFATIENDPRLRNGSRSVLDVRLGLSGLNDRWRLTALVRNLFDRRYLIRPSDSVFLPGGVIQAVVSDPRVVGIELGLNF